MRKLQVGIIPAEYSVVLLTGNQSNDGEPAERWLSSRRSRFDESWPMVADAMTLYEISVFRQDWTAGLKSNYAEGRTEIVSGYKWR